MVTSAVPGESGENCGRTGDLDRLRCELERVDRELMRSLAERFRLAAAVGEVKREAGLPVVDPRQEAAVLRRIGGLARESGIAEEEARQIFWRIIDLSRRAQRQAGI
jgi:chorismate mutase